MDDGLLFFGNTALERRLNIEIIGAQIKIVATRKAFQIGRGKPV